MKKIYFLIFAVAIFIVFRSWFSYSLIASGDFWPYFDSQYLLRSLLQYAWDVNGGNGLGASSIPFLSIHLNFGIAIDLLGNYLNLPWIIVQRIVYLFPLIIITSLSSYFLFKEIFPKNNFAILSSFIYLFNTYFLMVIGGGQLHGVGMSYSLVPLVFLLVIRICKHLSIKNIFLISLVLGFQAIFDLRIFYITFFSLLIFFMFNINGKNLIKKVSVLAPPLLIVVLLHAFWILPFSLYPSNPVEDLGQEYSSVEAVRFFSFAKIENSISLLHPNWPENIFGKVGFVKPEFMVLPIIAFSSLLFIKKDLNRNIILFFVFISFVGIFLAKGSNDPFGEVYIWLFENFPGFQIFRDPTKWYTIIALSYSILIPYTVSKLSKKNK